MEKEIVYPYRLIKTEGRIENAEALFQKRDFLQIGLNEPDCVIMYYGASIILDYGKEYCGGVRLLTYDTQGSCCVRIRFGESVTECCSELGEKGASNDHSLRDFVVRLVKYSDMEFGQTGFRFVRIDFISGDLLRIKSIVASSEKAETERRGNFICNDKLLNQIFETAAYTLELCQRNGVLWDGIKRDRLVWAGDLHAQMLGTLSLYKADAHVRNSLRFLREQTALPAFMNNIPAYSLWWMVSLCDYYLYTGDENFLKENASYFSSLIDLFDSSIDKDGNFCFPENTDRYFFDLDTYQTSYSQAGVYAVAQYAFCKIEKIAEKIGFQRQRLIEIRKRLHRGFSDGGKAQIIAMQMLGGNNSEEIVQRLGNLDAENVSAYMSYYIFSAMAEAGYKPQVLQIIRRYFGTMLDLGATTFWEEFKMSWRENSIRIDELPKEGSKNAHADFGNYCFSGLRKSLCHGWSASPVAYFMKYVLGINIVKPGYAAVYISPNLCGLEWAKGSLPTPHGKIEMTIQNNNNKTAINMKAPKGIQVSVDDALKEGFLLEQ